MEPAAVRTGLQLISVLLLMLCVRSSIQLKPRCERSEFGVLTCNNVTVEDIVLPEDVNSVILTDFDMSTLREGVFTINSNWSRLLNLKIFGDTASELGDKVFRGLHKLQTIGVHNSKLFSMSLYVFEGLDNLTTLDLSYTSKIPATYVMERIGAAEMPKLEKVVLKRMQTYYPDSIAMDYTFFRHLTKNGTRRIKYLDVSYTSIGQLDYQYVLKFRLCECLHTVIMRGCTIVSVYNYLSIFPCSSLKYIDFSGAMMPITSFNITPSSTDFTCIAMRWYFNVEEYHIENLMKKSSSPPMVITDTVLNMAFCPIRIKKLNVRGNTLKWVNVSATLHEITAENFQWADASDNLIEYVSPTFLAPSKNIRHFNLAGNRLYVMQQQYLRDFEVLFNAQTNLENISLSDNGLDNLPVNMFQKNRYIRNLDLSKNNFNSVTFQFDSLEKLKLLNLSWNNIRFIDKDTRAKLEFSWQRANIHGAEFRVDLSGNKFTCSCNEKEMEFLRWLTGNLKTFLTGTNGNYHCLFQNNDIDIANGGLYKVQSVCEWEITKHYLYIFGPVTAALIIILLTVSLIRLRHLNRERQRTKWVNLVSKQLRTNKFPKPNLVFASFCSEDETLVTEQILPNLQRSLQSIVNTSKELIVQGDALFRPGFPIIEEIMRGVNDCAVIILFVSKRFCEKQWCQQEIREAYEQNKPIVVIMLEKVDTKLMGKVLEKIFRRYAHARWVSDDSGGHLEPDWLPFCQSLIALAGPVSEKQTVASSECSSVESINISSVTIDTSSMLSGQC